MCDQSQKAISYEMSPTCSNFTGGRPRTKFDKHHVACLNKDNLECGCSRYNIGNRAPWLRIRSLWLGESPAMFPKAPTVCSSKRNQTQIK